ncbi:MAG: hypothetical protein ACE5Q6_03085 [Dehalococcoidia bacterium]
MSKPDVLVIGISSPSGGGKTTLTRRVAELLPEAIAIFFDDYDFDTIHPDSFRKWLEQGADYNAWKTPKLAKDLQRLRSRQSIVSPVDGLAIIPSKFVVFDAPLGYAHSETAELIDFMVFIDTPLDVAMARRLLRDFPSTSKDGLSSRIDCLRAQLNAYVDYGRLAYLEMDQQIKSGCDLIIDGTRPVDEIAHEIVWAINAKVV